MVMPVYALTMLGKRAGWLSAALSLVAYFAFGLLESAACFAGFSSSGLPASNDPMALGYGS